MATSGELVKREAKQRVLLIAAIPDSIVSFRGRLIEALVADGCDVHVAVPGIHNEPSIADAIRALGASVHQISLSRTGINPVADFVSILSMFILMRRLQPHVTLPYTIKPVIYGTFAAWLARVPRRYALITGLGFAFTGARRGVIPAVVKALYLRSLSLVHKAFFQNPDDRADLVSLGVLHPSVKCVIVNGSGVDVDEYAFSPLNPDSAPIFLMIARLLGDKGVREFADAAGRVKHLRPGARFQLAGWIDSNPDAISQRELGEWTKSGAIEYLGRLSDVRPALKAATGYVLPSYREGTPRTVLEAMAVGRAIITTNVPGCRETVVDGENGILVPPRSSEMLAGAMLKLIDDRALAAEMGRMSRRFAEDRYDVRKVNAVMLREMEVTVGKNEGAHGK